MKRIILILFLLLLPCSLMAAEKNYLFENFYYGMPKTAIEEKLEKVSSEGTKEVFVGEKRFIATMYFTTMFVFDNKKLVEVFLGNDLSSEYQRYEQFDNKNYLFYKVREYVNSFATTFLYSSATHSYYGSMPIDSIDLAIKTGFIYYWAVGKSTFEKARHNAPKGLPSLLKRLPKNKRIIQVNLADSILVISFKRFRDTNKKGSYFYSVAQNIIKNTE